MLLYLSCSLTGVPGQIQTGRQGGPVSPDPLSNTFLQSPIKILFIFRFPVYRFRAIF